MKVNIIKSHTPYSLKLSAKNKSATAPNFSNLKDTFISQIYQKPIKEITEIKAGIYGTCCKGSIALSNFFKNFNKKEIDALKQKGLSTNTNGRAYCLLKTKAENPISTSFVHDCSVLYLYNKKKNTHFLYHIFSRTDRNELSKVEQTFMPEGATNACIIPGDKEWYDRHREYLQKVFDTVKENFGDIRINVFHFSSKNPEIVGYKGKVFEIPNREIKRQIKLNEPYRNLIDYGQASFKIQNLFSYEIFTKIKYCKTQEDINKLKKEFNEKKYDKTIYPILSNLLKTKAESLKQK